MSITNSYINALINGSDYSNYKNQFQNNGVFVANADESTSLVFDRKVPDTEISDTEVLDTAQDAVVPILATSYQTTSYQTTSYQTISYQTKVQHSPEPCAVAKLMSEPIEESVLDSFLKQRTTVKPVASAFSVSGVRDTSTNELSTALQTRTHIRTHTQGQAQAQVQVQVQASMPTRKLLTGLFSLATKLPQNQNKIQIQTQVQNQTDTALWANSVDKYETVPVPEHTDESTPIIHFLSRSGVKLNNSAVKCWIKGINSTRVFEQISAMSQLNEYLRSYNIRLMYSGKDSHDNDAQDVQTLARTKNYWLVESCTSALDFSPFSSISSVSDLHASFGSVTTRTSRRNSIRGYHTQSEDLQSVAD